MQRRVYLFLSYLHACTVLHAVFPPRTVSRQLTSKWADIIVERTDDLEYIKLAQVPQAVPTCVLTVLSLSSIRRKNGVAFSSLGLRMRLLFYIRAGELN